MWWIILAVFGLIWLLYAVQDRKDFEKSATTILVSAVTLVAMGELAGGEVGSWQWGTAAVVVSAGLLWSVAVPVFIVFFLYALITGKIKK